MKKVWCGGHKPTIRVGPAGWIYRYSRIVEEILSITRPPMDQAANSSHEGEQESKVTADVARTYRRRSSTERGWLHRDRSGPVRDSSEDIWRTGISREYQGALKVGRLWHLYYGQVPTHTPGAWVEIPLAYSPMRLEPVQRIFEAKRMIERFLNECLNNRLAPGRQHLLAEASTEPANPGKTNSENFDRVSVENAHPRFESLPERRVSG